MFPRLFARASIVARASRAIAIASLAAAFALASPLAADAAEPSGRKSKTERAASGASAKLEPKAERGPGGRAPGKLDPKTERASGERAPAKLDPKLSKAPLSIGAPNRGQLRNGARLRGTKNLRQREGARSWGLPALVRLLRRASAAVAKKHPGSVLMVGDLSARRGGPIDGHTSHQSGRDADVGFFVANSKGKHLPTKHFIAFDASGAGRDFTWARFDDARNWTLIEALLSDEEATVRYIFVTHALRARLLAYAAKKRAPKELITRAASVLMSPKDADLHDDHFHIRIACPASMQQGVCADEPLAREPAPSSTPAAAPAPANVTASPEPIPGSSVRASSAAIPSPRDALSQGASGATNATEPAERPREQDQPSP